NDELKKRGWISMQDAYIVAYGRSAAGKAKPGGALFHERPDEVGAQVLKGVLDKIEGSFDYSMVDDVILGNAFPEGLQGQNMARSIALLACLPKEVPGQTVNRYCSSGLQTIAIAANEIMSEQADVLVAGGRSEERRVGEEGGRRRAMYVGEEAAW